MPMTDEESRKSVGIFLKYLSPRETKALAAEMWRDVGESTANDSVRDTLLAIKDLTESQELPEIPTGVYAAWLGVFAAHCAVAGCNLVSACVMVFCGLTGQSIPSWAIAFPVVTFVAWSSISRSYDCPLTRVEDWLRSKHGLPPVKAFLKHYLVSPLRRAWRLP